MVFSILPYKKHDRSCLIIFNRDSTNKVYKMVNKLSEYAKYPADIFVINIGCSNKLSDTNLPHDIGYAKLLNTCLQIVKFYAEENNIKYLTLTLVDPSHIEDFPRDIIRKTIYAFKTDSGLTCLQPVIQNKDIKRFVNDLFTSYRWSFISQFDIVEGDKTSVNIKLEQLVHQTGKLKYNELISILYADSADLTDLVLEFVNRYDKIREEYLKKERKKELQTIKREQLASVQGKGSFGFNEKITPYHVHPNCRFLSKTAINTTNDTNMMNKNVNAYNTTTTRIINPKQYKYDISIVASYYNRKEQFTRTLESFKQYEGKYSFEVIVVDDNSNEDNKLDELVLRYNFPIKLVKITQEEKGNRINPCSAYNKGFNFIEGRITIIQNPECYHVGDVIGYTLLHMDERQYFVFSCYNTVSTDIALELIDSESPSSNNYKQVILNKINDEDFNRRNETLHWYNHPKHRNCKFHFCSAIHTDHLRLIGGFNDDFADSSSYDDNEFLLAIEQNLKLQVINLLPDPCFVIHQWHPTMCGSDMSKNKKRFENIKNVHNSSTFKYPKLLHLYWDGSPMSALNYLTVVSFNKHNPGWKIIVYMPLSRTINLSWKTSEHKIPYTGRCWFNKLRDINNVSIYKVDFDQIGFQEEAAEVIKSDYFRYYILYNYGGVWSDFDILYMDNLDKMAFSEHSIMFKCTDSNGFQYYPIGLMISMPKTKLFNYLLSQCPKFYNKNKYQGLGAQMLNTIFKNGMSDIAKIDNSVRLCDHTYYLPWQWNELDEFYVKSNNTLPETNVGIHWFNGAKQSKDFITLLDKRLKNFAPECYIDTLIKEYIITLKE